jgi:hypothetical protein
MKRIWPGAAALSIILSLPACAIFTRHPLPAASVAACRATPAETAVTWIAPDDPGNRARLDSYCAAVGPVLFESPAASQPAVRADLRDVAFVSWNLHVGAADVERFVADLRSGRLTDGRKPAHVVLMLQEAVRAAGVPGRLPDGASSARRIGSAGGRGDHREIEAIARDLGMSVFYAPSMRNGAESGRYAPTDRGNAILSTLPLSAPAAIELPGDRQRRVAITAAIPVRIGEQDLDLGIGVRAPRYDGPAADAVVIWRVESARGTGERPAEGAARRQPPHSRRGSQQLAWSVRTGATGAGAILLRHAGDGANRYLSRRSRPRLHVLPLARGLPCPLRSGARQVQIRPLPAGRLAGFLI